MAELKCSVDSCLYNTDHMCSKGDIMVGGKNACKVDETCCESFNRRREDAFSSSIAHPSRLISIDCEAGNCKYNSNYKCVANQVDIRGFDACQCGETACATFSEK